MFCVLFAAGRQEARALPIHSGFAVINSVHTQVKTKQIKDSKPYCSSISHTPKSTFADYGVRGQKNMGKETKLFQ